MSKLFVVVSGAGTDDETIVCGPAPRKECDAWLKRYAPKASHRVRCRIDIMRVLDDGTLTTEY